MSKTKAIPGYGLWIILFVFALILVSSGFSQQDETEELVSKVAERMSDFPEIENYEAEVSAILIYLDKNWKAKKTTLVEKTVRMQDGLREEEIQSAVETEKGKKKDVTQKLRDEARKQQEKAKKERAKQEREGNEESKGGGRQELTMDEMFPFNEKKRDQYTFQRREDVAFAGKTALVLESKAKLRSDKYYEGTYYIDPDSFEVLRAFIQPAKNPGPLKKLEMEFLFQITPEGYFVTKEMRIRIHVGLVVKNIRMEIQEIYKSYRRLVPGGAFVLGRGVVVDNEPTLRRTFKQDGEQSFQR